VTCDVSRQKQCLLFPEVGTIHFMFSENESKVTAFHGNTELELLEYYA